MNHRRLFAACAAGAAFAFAGTTPSHASGMLCPSEVDASYSHGWWEGEAIDASTHAPLMEIIWTPGTAGDVGSIACRYAPHMSRFPMPTLRSRFEVLKPDSSTYPSWHEEVTRGQPWMLCSGATMEHFDPAGCPFEPAGPLPPPNSRDPGAGSTLLPF